MEKYTFLKYVILEYTSQYERSLTHKLYFPLSQKSPNWKLEDNVSGKVSVNQDVTAKRQRRKLYWKKTGTSSVLDPLLSSVKIDSKLGGAD